MMHDAEDIRAAAPMHPYCFPQCMLQESRRYLSLPLQLPRLQLSLVDLARIITDWGPGAWWLLRGTQGIPTTTSSMTCTGAHSCHSCCGWQLRSDSMSLACYRCDCDANARLHPCIYLLAYLSALFALHTRCTPA